MRHKCLKGRVCFSSLIETFGKPISPTREEIEDSLPGFEDQYIPQIMTVEVLEELFPYVQQVRNERIND